MVYRIAPGWAMEVEAMEAALAKMPFQPCGATQPESYGWAPPRGQAHGALVELVAGQRILRFMHESKAVPGSVVKRRLEERCAQIDEKEGRKPGRKESRELRDEIVQELLPMAFARTSSILVWLDLAQGRLHVLCRAWTTEPAPLYFVIPNRRQLTPLLRCLREFVAQRIAALTAAHPDVREPLPTSKAFAVPQTTKPARGRP